MSEFFDIIFSLPTAAFTWPLMVITLYWIVALAGLFNLEWFDGAHGALDGAVDGALDGAADGLAHVGDALPDGSLELHHGAEAMPSPIHHFGFGGVPRSYSWSLMVLFGWLFSVAGSYYVPGFQELATRGLWLALLLAGASLVLGIGATAIAIQPLRRAMEAGYGPHRRDNLGQMCTVTTLRVDKNFGQAELDDGSSLVQVRDRQGRDFTRGSRAVIFDYDAEQEVFWIAPLDLDGT